MGKSAVAEALRASGTPVVDTDAIARQLTQPGSPAVAEIARVFGASVLRPDGSLNRGELARVVFQDDQARAALESMLHPPIRAAWIAEAARWRASGATVGVVVIPLLFETGAQSHFNAVVCVACSAATQERRLRERGWAPRDIAGRLAAQWPIEKKIAAAQHVIWTDTTLEVTGAQAARIVGR